MERKEFWLEENLKRVNLIVYSLMALRVALSFLAWTGMIMVAVILTWLLDAMDGFIPWLAYRKRVQEFKHKLDYGVDGISRFIMLVPLFLYVLPGEHMLWFVLLYVWYYVSIILRIRTGYIEVMYFTCPINAILIGYFVLPMLGLALAPWMMGFLFVGMVYNVIWHGGMIMGYRH